ncbi:MAG: hypothetical protein K6F53_05745 [Lachnospiraceae bacterium]|nr:hypothetical protein [Lachnospiraceae bacterium]
MENKYLLFVLLVLVCGWLSAKEMGQLVADRTIILGAALGLLSPIVAVYPMALGYSSATSLPNRCAFIVDVAIMLSMTSFSFWTGVLCNNLLITGIGKKAVLAMVGILFIGCLFTGNKFSDYKICSIILELKDKTYEDHYYAFKDFLNQIESNGEGKDVRIPESKMIYSIDNICNFYLFNDPNDEMNMAVAKCLGLNTIAISDEVYDN